MTIHTVLSGESIASISAYYDVDPLRLAADNAVPVDGALAVGQTLVIRFPDQLHIVRSGETLTSIAEQYDTSLRTLWRNNWSLGGTDLLSPGQTLVISYLEEPDIAIETNGYAYPYIESPLLYQQLAYLSFLSPFTYGITAEGSLLPLADDLLLTAARKQGTMPVMHLSTLTESGRFSTERAVLVLTDSSVQDALIQQILQTLRMRGYRGLDVDFEYLPGELAAPYAVFLGRLQRLVHSLGKFLWVALAPKTSSSQPGLLYEGHDYSLLGASVDGVLLMTYEWGYTLQPC